MGAGVPKFTALHDEWMRSDPAYLAEDIAMDVTETCARIMQERGISRADLAERMGVSRAYITKVFNSPPNLTLQTIAALALALDLRPTVRFEPGPPCAAPAAGLDGEHAADSAGSPR